MKQNIEKIIAWVCLVVSCIVLTVPAISFVGLILSAILMITSDTTQPAIDFLLALIGCLIPAVSILALMLTLQEWAVAVSDE